MSEEQIADYVRRVSSEIPAGRVGTAEDIADALVFLATRREPLYLRYRPRGRWRYDASVCREKLSVVESGLWASMQSR
jgi:NAD(P)-dependent dehydrogenase (short-subunit alcohol dehydrogenase family)